MGELFCLGVPRDDASIIFTGWGSPLLDSELLAGMPALQVVFHAAGSVRGIVSPEFWNRGIQLSSAWQINARPVAEFTVAQITLALKHALFRSRSMHRDRKKPGGWCSLGAAGSVVGLVGLGAIGRQVMANLKLLEVRVLAFDPFVEEAQARTMGVELVSLEDVFRRSDVVSLHAPAVSSTYHMVHGELLRSMKPGATLINTARGSLVNEADLIRVFGERDDVFAVLDVTDPDPPAPDSPLYDHPNIFLTPHIAGSVGQECLRMGDAMVAEAQRYLNGEPLLFRLNRQQAEAMT